MGVFVPWPGSNGASLQGYCVAWSSFFASMDLMECNQNRTVCAKAGVKHFHGMSMSAAALVYKRLKCVGLTCYVYKSGRCVDVGEDVYSSEYWDHSDMETNGAEYNKAFGEKAEAKLRDGHAAACTDHDMYSVLANAGIRNY